MTNLDLKHEIKVPFAQDGEKDNIPDTNPDGFVNNTDGFGEKYDTPIAEGGEYIEREMFNGIFYKIYAAVKELQDLAIRAGFPVDMTKALNVLPIANGGTGANNATKARSNLGLGTLATKSTITSADITDGTITTNDIANNAITSAKIQDGTILNADIANGAVTDSKLSGVVSISHGGTGRNDGISTGVADNKLITEDNWQDEAKRGMSILYWQTADIASKKLPYTAGAMIRNYFVSNLKSALAFDLRNAYVSIFDFKQNRWKQIAFNDDVVNKMPKVSKNNGIGYLQQIRGQGAPVTYRLPSDGTYFYFLTCTNDYNNYSAMDNITGIDEGGKEILTAAMNKKTFGGFIWRIQ